MDFPYAGTAFTSMPVYAPSTAANRPYFYSHRLLPQLPTDCSLITGGAWICMSSELDLLDPAAPPAGFRASGTACGY